MKKTGHLLLLSEKFLAWASGAPLHLSNKCTNMFYVSGQPGARHMGQLITWLLRYSWRTLCSSLHWLYLVPIHLISLRFGGPQSWKDSQPIRCDYNCGISLFSRESDSTITNVRLFVCQSGRLEAKPLFILHFATFKLFSLFKANLKPSIILLLWLIILSSCLDYGSFTCQSISAARKKFW